MSFGFILPKVKSKAPAVHAPQTLMEALKFCTLGDFLRVGAFKAVVARSDDNITKVLDLLISNRLLSCPIKNEKGHWCGFVDVQDYVRHVVQMIEAEIEQRRVLAKEKAASSPPTRKVIPTGRKGPFDPLPAMTRMTTNIEELKPDFPSFVAQIFGQPNKIKNMMAESKRNEWLPLSPKSHVLNAFVSFEVNASCVRRIPIVGKRQELVGIFTRTDAIKFLYKYRDLLGPLGQRTDLFPPKKVYSVYAQEPSVNALLIMHDDNVSACAVIGKSGQLVASLYADDLRDLGAMSQGGMLDLSVGKYIKRYSERKTVCVSPDAKLYEIIEKLALKNTRHLWMVDPRTRECVNVISQVDVILVVLNYLREAYPEEDFTAHIKQATPPLTGSGGRGGITESGAGSLPNTPSTLQRQFSVSSPEKFKINE